jgi:hypothetical protein
MDRNKQSFDTLTCGWSLKIGSLIALETVATSVLASALMNTYDIPAPPDADQVGDWSLDHDGYGRPFRGTRRGEVVIQGWQHADGRAERSILIDGPGELKHPRATAHAILDAIDEMEALR